MPRSKSVERRKFIMRDILQHPGSRKGKSPKPHTLPGGSTAVDREMTCLTANQPSSPPASAFLLPELIHNIQPTLIAASNSSHKLQPHRTATIAFTTIRHPPHTENFPKPQPSAQCRNPQRSFTEVSIHSLFFVVVVVVFTRTATNPNFQSSRN